MVIRGNYCDTVDGVGRIPKTQYTFLLSKSLQQKVITKEPVRKRGHETVPSDFIFNKSTVEFKELLGAMSPARFDQTKAN